MSGRIFGARTYGIQKRITRWLLICCLATVMTVTFMIHAEEVVFAAPVFTPTVRQDRRPDRERAVTMPQGNSIISGFSQGSSSSNTSSSSAATPSATSSSSQARPRLVRR